MKVLVIVNSNFGYDGISKVATNYYIYKDKSIRMDLVTLNEIDSFLGRKIVNEKNKHFILSSRNSNPFIYIINLAHIIRQGRYDIIHIHGNSATMVVELIAAYLGGCKVRIAHSHNTRCNHQRINNILMPWFSLLYTDACACSKEAGDFLFKNRSFFIANNGIDFDKYKFSLEKRNKIRKKYKIENNFIIGHIGRFSKQKNHLFILKVFIEVLKYDATAMLLLVGEGELENFIRKNVEEHKIVEKVIFYGTTDKVNEVVQAMDCFLFPSLFEGLGIVAIEAQASGIACIASEQVPQTVKIGEMTKFLSLNAGVEKWAKEVLKSKITPEERNDKINEVHQTIIDNNFDIKKNCQEMKDYYNKILYKENDKKTYKKN